MTFFKVILKQLKIIPVLLIVSGILYGCENDMKEVASLTNKEDIPVRKGKNVELIYSEKSDVKIKITAPKMEEYINEKHYMEMKDGIKVSFYDSLMNVSSTLTSNYAINKVDEKIMEAKDDVVVVNAEGEQLNTEHLIWSQDSSKIYTNEFVKITTGDEIIMGEGMEANQDFTKWKIHKISGTILLKEEQDSLKTN